MDFEKRIIVLAIIYLAICALKASCQVSLYRNFDPQDCIVEGTVVTLTCTVEDRNEGFGATIIDGSQDIFDCPSVNSILANQLYLRHFHMESAIARCGDLVSGRIVEVVEPLNGTISVYIAQINITTTIAMSGDYVRCAELGREDSQQIKLPNNTEALPNPPTIYVDFPYDATFFIHWNSAAQISNYSINVTGEDCGKCDTGDLIGIVSDVTNQLSCTGWEPKGQVCNVTVTAITFVCDLQRFKSSSHLVYLRVPEAPHLEDLLPAYSFDLKKLLSLQIVLAVDVKSTVDSNGLPITFQVDLVHSDNLKCSLKISATDGPKCQVKNAVQFQCEIDFTDSSCPQLFLQGGQDDYQIEYFSKNSIGRSAISNVTVPSYASFMNLESSTAEPQKSYNFSFSLCQEYDREIDIIYGASCQALALDDSNDVTFLVPDSINNICCIVTAMNNTLTIQGNFTMASNSQDATQTSELIYIIIIGSVLIVTIIPIIIILSVVVCKCCVRRRLNRVSFKQAKSTHTYHEFNDKVKAS